MKRRVLFWMTLVALTLGLAASAFGFSAYDSLNWVAAKGTALYALNERETAQTSFIYYQEVFTDGTKKYSAHFLCKHNGIETQIPVAEIRSIKLAIAPKEFGKKYGLEKLKKLILTMKNGKSFPVEVEFNMGYALANYDSIEFKYFNPVTDRFEFGGVSGDNLREIRFD